MPTHGIDQHQNNGSRCFGLCQMPALCPLFSSSSFLPYYCTCILWSLWFVMMLIWDLKLTLLPRYKGTCAHTHTHTIIMWICQITKEGKGGKKLNLHTFITPHPITSIQQSYREEPKDREPWKEGKKITVYIYEGERKVNFDSQEINRNKRSKLFSEQMREERR